jgi:sec-independent protein translocase protein TatB
MFPEGRALEFLLAAVVALVVVGPKDLPILMRKLGQFLGKMRAMAAEFRASFDEMARQSELDELRKEVEAMRKAQFADVAAQAGAAEAAETIDGVRDQLGEVGAELHGATPPYYSDTLQPQAIPEAAAAKPQAKRAAPRKAASRAPATRKAAGARTAATPAKPRAKKKPEAEA